MTKLFSSGIDSCLLVVNENFANVELHFVQLALLNYLTADEAETTVTDN